MQHINPDGTSDIFDDLLAHILEWVGQLVADVIPHRPRDADPTGLGKGFQACCDVHTVAEDIVLLNDHVAEINADAEPNAPLVWHLRLAVAHPALDLSRAAYCVDHAREFRQQAVASVLHNTAPMLLDLRNNQLPEMRLEAFVRAFLVHTHQT